MRSTPISYVSRHGTRPLRVTQPHTQAVSGANPTESSSTCVPCKLAACNVWKSETMLPKIPQLRATPLSCVTRQSRRDQTSILHHVA
ncbi:hypothetical protein P8452_46025 [Trifolium repens]|nr:hypothetical protein P8452_46025 [Trifolium repens]